MKKSLLLSLFTVTVIGATAQITITSADIASPPKIMFQGTDTISTVSYGSAGPSQTWNLAGLANNGTDTINFLTPAMAPNPAYPSSNVVFRDGWQANYGYLTNSASMLTAEGFSGMVDFGTGPTQLNQKNTPSEKIMTFPATFGTNFVNDYNAHFTVHFGLDIGGGIIADSIRQHVATHKVVTVDGWGTVITPLGSYPALRVKETKVTHDTTDIFIAMFGGWQNDQDDGADSVAQYTWWANGIGFPIAEVKLDSAGTKNYTWLMVPPTSTVGINGVAASIPVNLYPNPAQTEINVMLPSTNVKGIQVYDVTGRLLNTYGISSDITNISISEYSNGSYTYSVISNENEVLSRGKFTVAK